VSETSSDQPSVLVVDDNPLIVNVVKSLLLAENYHVITSRNGQEAVDLLSQKNVDVIICDVMMPTMDGYQFHDLVRKNADYAHIPFVFLTALGDPTEVNNGKALGVDDYLVKPFDPRTLISVVKGKITRSRSVREGTEQRYDSYRRKVIHTLSHEFRTPLVAINTGTELLLDQQRNLDREKVNNLLEAIRRGGQRLERLVNDFMVFQQIEAGIAARMFETRALPLKVCDCVQQVLSADREGLAGSGFTVTFTDHSQQAEARVYEPQLHDILGRLLANCVKFSPNVKNIEVVLYTEEQEVVIEVRDRGIGMDVTRVREAIDVFGQINREKLEQQGGGLGLAIVNRYLAIAGGSLDFEPRSGGGTTVIVRLPRAGAVHP
jgi:signal transduction histidine kinase